MVASALHARWKDRHAEVAARIQAEKQLSRFSPQEQQVVEFFVRAGGACVSWGYVNNSPWPFPRPAVNSLMARGLLVTSVMEDSMSESFQLDVDLFDTAQRVLADRLQPHPSTTAATTAADDDDIPF